MSRRLDGFAPCKFDKTEHVYLIKLYCKLCDRDIVTTKTMACHRDPSHSRGLTKREMGCAECERNIIMYFYCHPNHRDYDNIGHGSRKIIMTVENMDVTP